MSARVENIEGRLQDNEATTAKLVKDMEDIKKLQQKGAAALQNDKAKITAEDDEIKRSHRSLHFSPFPAKSADNQVFGVAF